MLDISDPKTPASSIALSGWEVRAILAGRKTQLRRPVKPSTSTVLGYEVTAKSKDWIGLDLSGAWMDRGFPDPRGVYRYGYLHVPFSHPDELREDWEGVRYRVRPRWCDGDVLTPRNLPMGLIPFSLEIVSVRPERALDVDEDGARAEGLTDWLDTLGPRLQDRIQAAQCRWSRTLDPSSMVATARGLWVAYRERMGWEGEWC